MAIDSIAELRSRQADVHLILVGDGAEQPALRSRCVALGIDDYVHFAGHRDDIGRWLAAFDIYINCSNSEGLSQSITEAMAMGLPLVVTDVGDSALLVGDAVHCGVLVPAGDTLSLCDSVFQLIGNIELRNSYSHAARERHGMEYGFSRMIGAYGALYQTALDVRHGIQR
jgi:glycosyltransferase involved in cell wall biosynthesis